MITALLVVQVCFCIIICMPYFREIRPQRVGSVYAYWLRACEESEGRNMVYVKPSWRAVLD